ncbi:HAMP domain-containing sensor histidine kinase [Pontibacter cellulosilyticus]|uniref:histidine kinase n=1 Tax=Pontibacter cellulosilyticus TaxID=1720253 RepID=A0A923NAN0_9BACT|nr:HAMP domain-containing sensor histidine kinase [Pontibacter cellulosilyticus]MBC5994426.1 HAMP domain-containing histidine kinase [Pontibacter cellulosilyticus]
MKIRYKLTLQFTSIFALILIFFSLVIYYFTSIYRQEDFYKRIYNRALVTAKYVLESEGLSQSQKRQNEISYHQELPYEAVRVFKEDGTLRFSDGKGELGVKQRVLNRIKEQQIVQYEQGVRQVVGVYHSSTDGNYFVLASSVDAYSLRKLQHLKVILIVGFFGSMIVILIAGWVFSGQALIPITKVVSEVEKISANDLHMRLSNANGKDEISHLAQTFNKMLDRLESSFEMQSTFVSNASHELRTPLTAMIGELEVALMNPREPQEYERVLQSILEDARLLTELSNGLLQIAQASIDPSKIKLTHLRFDELIWTAHEQVLKRLPNARINIDFANFPDDEDRLIIKGNEALLLIAVVNVLENAVKFTPTGQTVNASIILKGDKVILEVADQGLGINKEDLKHVFVPFFRAENVRNITGHGIGLPLAERILKLHKGHILVESIINKGTKVTIKVPQAYLFIPNKY